ncbi:MAG TPA: hypothetical protein VF157_09280 [Chloroflexota bacterium]
MLTAWRPASPAEPDLARIREFLRELGAETFPHAHGRSLYEHLVGTAALLERWRQPVWLCAAGLLHSIYSTDVYKLQLLPLSRRDEVRGLAGDQAERIAYLFCEMSRKHFADLFAAGATVPEGDLDIPRQPDADTPTLSIRHQELAPLLLVQLANEAEQSQAKDGGPGSWVAQSVRLGKRLAELGAEVPPMFAMDVRVPVPGAERDAAHAYAMALDALEDPGSAAISLDSATRRCGWLAEPHVWRAYLAARAGDAQQASREAITARTLLQGWGTPWDKRLTYTQWLTLIDRLEQGLYPPHGAASTRDFLQRARNGRKARSPTLNPNPWCPACSAIWPPLPTIRTTR